MSTTFNPTTTIKERARISLNDEFLRNAVKYTTEKLRTSKKLASDELGNWEEWRERARQIRLHTIAHLDYYLSEFVKNARANGVHVHFASTAREAVDITLKIAEAKGAKSVVKSKSMVSEELHINHRLEEIGVEAIETDLGEYIIQLAGEYRLISLFRPFIKISSRSPTYSQRKQAKHCRRKRLSLQALPAPSCARNSLKRTSA